MEEKKVREELKKCPFCGHEIDEQKDLYLPERDWHPTFYDPDSGGDTIYIHCECGLEFSTGTHDYVMYGNPTTRTYGPEKLSFTSALAREEWAKYAKEVHGEEWKKVYQAALKRRLNK